MIIAVPFILVSTTVSWIIQTATWIYRKLLKKKLYITKYSYIIIFSKTTNRVVNIHITSKKEYFELRDYFLKTLNIDLNIIDTNFNLSNIQKGVEYGG